MRLLALILAAAALTSQLDLPRIVSPASSQPYDFFETHDQAEKRRQAEQYRDEQEQRRRGNLLNSEKPRPLGEAPPAALSKPRARPDQYDPNRPRECPPNHYHC